MQLEKMIDELNEYVDGTLSITHYVDWELRSYRKNSLFHVKNRVALSAKKLSDLIKTAYGVMEKDREEKKNDK